MDKLKLAHDWAMKSFLNHGFKDEAERAVHAWKYADAMQAEADKRECKERPEVLKEEWHPDWSKAPEWANWWAMDGFSEKANWYIDKPYLDDDSEVESEWNIDLRASAKTYIHAPSFGYQGNWKDSLRKRPQ